MNDSVLDRIRDLIQEDVGQRGLRTDPRDNLITACADDFRGACHDVAGRPDAALAVVTGFFIPHGQPPAAETDGPLGAVFLARALVPLGVKVVLAADGFCLRALEVGVNASGLRKSVPLVRLPAPEEAGAQSVADYWQEFRDRTGPLTHLVALERVGPTHIPDSVRQQPGADDTLLAAFLAEVPPAHRGRCHTMRGVDITTSMSPAHRLFEAAREVTGPLTTIGIGDGGNEIGMGKVPWDVIRRNVPRGGLVACRVPADYLIVAGISNWGAYGLAAGVRLLRHAPSDPDLFNPEREYELLQAMVEEGPLVDGVSGQSEPTVDGLAFDRYAAVLHRLGEIMS